jgi:hypothetical protein
MRLPVSFRTLARAEYDAAVAWYDQARAGLGSDFEAEVQPCWTPPPQLPIDTLLQKATSAKRRSAGSHTASTTVCGRTDWLFSPSITSRGTHSGGKVDLDL